MRRYRLTGYAYPVFIERDDDGSYLVSEDEFLVYGTDQTREGALKDYEQSLREYWQLVAAGAADNCYDRAELAHLRAMIPTRLWHTPEVVTQWLIF